MSRPESAGSLSRPLEGKLAIVTGASRGIGAAISEWLASRGASLVMNYTSAGSATRTQELASQLQLTHGITALPVQADMGSETGPAQLVDTARAHFSHPSTGRFQIDILVNNAGISVNRRIEECDAADFKRQYDVNVRGPLLLVQAARDHLPTDRSGRIVNLSSVSSSMGFVAQSVYGGTKAALEAMTRTWARELAERATVNAVNPGPVMTDMFAGVSDEVQRRFRPFLETTPLARERAGLDADAVVEAAKGDGGRGAYAWEIAGAVGLLCLPDAGWSTGSVLCANGGMRFSA